MGGTTFASALDSALQDHQTIDTRRGDPPFNAPICAHLHDLALKPIPPSWVAHRYPRPAAARPVRSLGPAERHALDELVGLGARLREDFTSAELRSAFRALARRFHPDRCIGQTPADQAHAARVFAFIVGHYRCLSACGDL
jgi:hypothetical protein